MYAIYGNIDHQYTPVMLAYIPYMDPMGYVMLQTLRTVFMFRTNTDSRVCNAMMGRPSDVYVSKLGLNWPHMRIYWEYNGISKKQQLWLMDVSEIVFFATQYGVVVRVMIIHWKWGP